MTYSTNVPHSSDPINTTYTPIATNFTILDTTFNTDHVPPTNATSANWGKHKQITMQVSASAPAPSGTESSVYTKTASAKQQLFFRNVQDGEEQLTFPKNLAASSGYTYLPGGLLMQWSLDTPSGTGPNIVTFPIAYSSAVYSIQCTIQKNSTFNNALSTNAGSTAGFNYFLNSSPAGAKVWWLAIGV